MESTERPILEPVPQLDPATGLYICNYCQTPGCPGVFNRLACNERSIFMRDETEAHYHPGERVRFYAYATEDRVGIIVGILYDAVADARRFYGYDLVSEGRGYRCSQEAIVGLAPESVLDEDVALRIMQYPSIRLVYDKDGGRYRLARRDENGVGHVDILAQRWPEVPGEEMPVQTGTITGLVSAEQVLFALKMALSQLQP